MNYRSPYESCIEVCGRHETPGAATKRYQINYVDCETTADQARIETVMSQMDLHGRSILHVGIGNSRLAQRFAPLAKLIDGITVSQAEKDFAISLGIRSYTAYMVNKYSRGVLSALSNRYDIIVDNNLASFSCCKFHFYLMMDNYSTLLKPGGRILTDQQGMDWVAGETGWKLTFQDLAALSSKFPLTAVAVTDKVFALQRAD